MRKNIRVGVIRWDSYTDSDLYYSYYGAKALSPEHYRNKIPFFGKILDGKRVIFPRYTKEVFKKEMEYAESAGIDYFVWFFYPPKGITDGYGHTSLTADAFGEPCSELDLVRRIYRKSPNKHRIKMCFQLSGVSLADSEIEEICVDMQQEWYEKTEGRPLLYLYDVRSESAQANLKRLLNVAREKGISPFLINQKADILADIPVDAYGAYSMPSSLRSMRSFSEYTEMVIDRNKELMEKGKKAVLHLSFGWDPTPRIENPVPWYAYPEIDYPPAPKNNEILEQAKRLKTLAECHCDAFFGHYSVFAWNEFEEGAWICPTLKSGGEIDCSHLQMLKDAICFLKNDEQGEI